METPVLPDPDELRASVAEVWEALADMAAGDWGRPADEVIEEVRRKYNLPPLP
jgi:hypothetical protein